MPQIGITKHRVTRSSAWALVITAGQIFATHTARGQGEPPMPDNGSMATVELPEMVEVSGPQDLPGKVDGSRERPPTAPEEPPAPDAPREWFGHAPYWDWSRLTGDWGGGRTWLEDKGLSIGASYTLDWSSVWSGGLRHVASTRSLLDVNATLDLDKVAGLMGGTVFADFYSSDMRGGSRDIGDFQGVDNIETGDNVDQIAEFWYEQVLFDGAVRVKVGKIDANSEFAISNSNPYFLHGSAAVSPTAYAIPTYPNPAFGGVVFWYPTERTYVAGGFFDGSAAVGVNTGRLGPEPLFHGSEYELIAEAGCSWESLGSLGCGRVGVAAGPTPRGTRGSTAARTAPPRAPTSPSSNRSPAAAARTAKRCGACTPSGAWASAMTTSRPWGFTSVPA